MLVVKVAYIVDIKGQRREEQTPGGQCLQAIFSSGMTVVTVLDLFIYLICSKFSSFFKIKRKV